MAAVALDVTVVWLLQCSVRVVEAFGWTLPTAPPCCPAAALPGYCAARWRSAPLCAYDWVSAPRAPPSLAQPAAASPPASPLAPRRCWLAAPAPC
jgi:hypothetical protein